MTPPADIIRQLLIDLNLAVLSGAWPVFVSFLPEVPDTAIAVYDTAGKIDGRLLADGFQVIHPGIQIRLRGPIYPDVWGKAEEIALALDAQKKVTVVMDNDESYMVHNISRTGATLPMGIEEEGDRRRHNFTINAVLTLEREE